MVTDQGYSIPKSLVALGKATNMRYRWKENAENQKTSITLTEDERTEFKSLREEVKTLQVEKDILKNSAPFLVKKWSKIQLYQMQQWTLRIMCHVKVLVHLPNLLGLNA